MLETLPDKLTLGDWQLEQGNLFTYLIDTAQVTYLAGVDADLMDFLLGSMFSQRKVRPFFEKLSAEEVGQYIHKVYSQRWTQDFDLYQRLATLEGDTVATSGTTRTTSTNQVNKTSGFDGIELVDDNGADITANDATDNTSTTLSQEGLLAKAEVARNHRFHERICEDIARFITLSIY